MNKQPYCLIGLDLGTSAIKGVLMSSKGDVIHREKAQTKYVRTEEGFVEFDAEEFYALTAGVIRRLTEALPKGALVAGISMASASGNTLLIDDAGNPMIPAISWMDKRVTDEIERVLGQEPGNDVYDLVGWPLGKTFPLAHLAWLKCHKPGLIEKASKVCMSTDYINYRLTGEWGIDTSTATTFFLQDQKAAKWHLPFLEKLGIPEHKLPVIKRPGEIVGRIRPEAALETGLLPGTPIVLGSFDHPCAARGSGVLEEGKMLISCGTSWVGYYPLRDRQIALSERMLVDPFLQPDGVWGVMFSLPAVATLVDKYISKYISSAKDRYRDFDKLAASAEPGAGGLLINPMKESFPDELNRHSKANIARALMEGTAYLLKMNMERVAKAGVKAAALTMVGGPSETFPWPQIVCDVLGLELSTVNGSCAGAAGAAVLAGIGAGLYRDVKDAFEKADFEKITRLPDKEAQEVYKRRYEDFKSRFGV
jgi:xylulokinase